MCFNDVRVHATRIRYGLSSGGGYGVEKMGEAREKERERECETCNRRREANRSRRYLLILRGFEFVCHSAMELHYISGMLVH